MPDVHGRLTVRECWNQCADWLDANEAFYHVRYNDGEWRALFRLEPPAATTSEEHHYTRDLCHAMRASFDELAGRILRGASRVLIGSDWQVCLQHLDGAAFAYYVNRIGLAHKATWADGNCWYATEDELSGSVDDKGIKRLCDSIRKASTRGLRVILVANRSIADARHCLGAEIIEVAKPDAWTYSPGTLGACMERAGEDSVFVWCAGFPSKVWSWEIRRRRPLTTHIDLGSFFDPVFSVCSRGWSRRADTEEHHAHWDYFHRELSPYVRSFIP